MRPIGRPLYNVATGLSALLCVATVVLWVRSYGDQKGACWAFTAFQDRSSFAGIRGRIEFGRLRPAEQVAMRPRQPVAFPDDVTVYLSAVIGPPNQPAVILPTQVVWEWAGCGEERGRVIPPWGWKEFGSGDLPDTRPTEAMPFRVWFVAFWIPTLLFAALPAGRGTFAWARAAKARRRLRVAAERGACPECGYDLRATPDRCPECGTLPATAAAKPE